MIQKLPKNIGSWHLINMRTEGITSYTAVEIPKKTCDSFKEAIESSKTKTNELYSKDYFKKSTCFDENNSRANVGGLVGNGVSNSLTLIF